MNYSFCGPTQAFSLPKNSQRFFSLMALPLLGPARFAQRQIGLKVSAIRPDGIRREPCRIASDKPIRSSATSFLFDHSSSSPAVNAWVGPLIFDIFK